MTENKCHCSHNNFRSLIALSLSLSLLHVSVFMCVCVCVCECSVNIKPLSRTRSSDHLCLSLPIVFTRLKFSDRSFRNSSPRLWNSLPINLRSFAPDTHHSTTVASSTPSHPCRALSLSRNQFLSCLKTHLFTLSYHPKFLCSPVSPCFIPDRPILTSTRYRLTPAST